MKLVTNRKIDELGRVVIPAEMRNKLAVSPGNTFDIELDENKIILTPHKNSCLLCKGENNLKSIGKNNFVCIECAEKILDIIWRK